MSVTPFRIDIPQPEVDDLRRRLAAARWAETPETPPGRLRGIDPGVLTSLFTRWRDTYDWYAHQTELNRFSQVETVVAGGQRMHALHVRSERSDAVPLVLIHGWPSTFAEYTGLVAPLTAPPDPQSPAFHVIAPSLPGFGFSSPTRRLGWNMDHMARAIIEVLEQLGHDHYLLHGSDAGQAIAERIATLVPERVIGLHLNVGGVKLATLNRDKPLEDDRERLAVARLGEYSADKAGYAVLQSTRPETLGYALTDSPLGQLAWIAEKHDEWGSADHPIDEDHVLTTASIYWFTRTAASSARFYSEEFARQAPVPYVATPTAGTAYPDDIVPAVRRWAEPLYNLVQWTEPAAGAHFAALEVPDIMLDSLRRFATTLAADRAAG